MLAFISLLGVLASGVNSIFKLVVRLSNYGYQFYVYLVDAAPPNLAAPPASPHSVLTVYRNEHTTTPRGTVKVTSTNIEFHHDPGQSLQSGMASHLNLKCCMLRKIVILCLIPSPVLQLASDIL